MDIVINRGLKEALLAVKGKGNIKDVLGWCKDDILIALSARRIGAAVITGNVKDFLRIGEWVKVWVWDG